MKEISNSDEIFSSSTNVENNRLFLDFLKCPCLGVDVCTPVEVRSQYHMSSSNTLHLFCFRQHLSLNLEFIGLSKLANQLASGIHLPSFPSSEIIEECHSVRLYVDVGDLKLGPHLRTLILTKNYF